MRIRSKLLLILLCLVVPPLVATGFYALHQAKLLGDELAERTADAFKNAAERELALMVELIGEDITDNRQMLELGLAFLAKEAQHALTGPVPRGQPVVFDTEFDAAGGLPAGVDRLPPLATSPSPILGAAPSLTLPPGLPPAQAMDDCRRLASLQPTLALLRHNLGDNLLWAYVALDNGLLATYPGHGGMPAGYDARTREWYTTAVKAGKPEWRLLVDASTKRLTATVAMPVTTADGRILGVAGIDAPLESMLPESDLSKRWGNGVSILIVTAEDTPQGESRIMVHGDREFIGHAQGWDTTLEPHPLDTSDSAALAELIRAVRDNRFLLISLDVGKTPSLAAYKPFPSGSAGLLVVVPRKSVLLQADLAESRILARTRGMMLVVGAFTLVAVVAAMVMASLGARGVTRPVMALCETVGQLAQGNLTARAPITGRDELSVLAREFNDMAPKLAERMRLKQDMLLAMEVQQHLLPKSPPLLPGLDIAGATLFCDETGGDYFDYLQFAAHAGNGCDVALGDVTGHGISAALFMATGRALMRGRADVETGPARLLTLVNGLLCQDTLDSGRFITLFFLRLADGGLAPQGRLLWTRAGHDPALLYDPVTDTFEELLGPGIPLGVVEDFVYSQQSRPGLTPGQLLVIGTDGIWEARDRAGEMYGKDRFQAVLRRHAADAAEVIVAAAQEDVARFQAGAPRDDDITLVVIKALATV
jgi:sigma-B regulation protein RsbU (phosphoserine phosphatase)